MSRGPVEFALIEFPGNHFKGEIAPALEELVASGTVKILDLIFITKDEAGDVGALELSSLSEEEAAPFQRAGVELGNLLGEEDVELASEGLSPGSSAALIVWENAWAARFVAAVSGADGRVLAHERIPAEDVDAALAAATAS